MEPQDLTMRQMGNGLPVLVIHGWTMSGLVEAVDFEPIFTKKTGYSRIYVDLPGMGETPIGSAKNLDDMFERVSNFIEKQILPSKFLLIGSSCGAYFARAVAYKYPSAVEGLLLRFPLVEPVSSKRDIDPFVAAFADVELLSSLSETDRELLGDIPIQAPEYITTYRERLERVVLPAIVASDATALGPIREDPMRYRLNVPLHSSGEPFLKPTLIATGRQDSDVGYRDAWKLMPAYPRATFVALDRANHGLPVDESERVLFESLIDNWLWRVEELRRFTVVTE
jgi:pimeloyl-ACP methyl ester carboxylesterase